MKPRTTLVLAVLAVLVVGAGWYFGARTTRPSVDSVATAGQPAFPNVAPRLQNAAMVEMTHQGSTIMLKRTGNVWGVVEDEGYPAKPGKVHDLLVGLAELRLAEPRTANPAMYDRLGVEKPGPKADSTLVSVSDKAGKPILSLIVGHSRTRGMPNLPDQIYVRRPGEAQSWLAEGRLPLEDDALMWLEREILNIDHGKIARVVSDRPGQPKIVLVRAGDKLAMKQPADHPKLDPAKVGDVQQALELLSFLRVRPAGKMPGSELGHSRFTTSDGMTVNVTVTEKGNEVWARFAAAGEGAAKPEAEKLEGRLKGWIYELGGWKEKALVPAMDDLKAPTPKPAVAKTVAPAKPASAPPAVTSAPATTAPATSATTTAAPAKAPPSPVRRARRQRPRRHPRRWS